MNKHSIPHNEMKFSVLFNDPLTVSRLGMYYIFIESYWTTKSLTYLIHSSPGLPPFLKCCIYKNNSNMAQKWNSQGKAKVRGQREASTGNINKLHVVQEEFAPYTKWASLCSSSWILFGLSLW